MVATRSNKNRYIVGGAVLLVLLVVASLYIFLPEDKLDKIEAGITQLSGTTQKLLDAYCSDQVAVPREYILGLVREQFPEWPEEGICGMYEHNYNTGDAPN